MTVERKSYEKHWGQCALCKTERPLKSMSAKPTGDGANRQGTAHVCLDTVWCSWAKKEREMRPVETGGAV